MFIEVISQSYRPARSVNQTSSSYVSKLPAATEPTGDAGTATGSSIIDLAGNGITVQNSIRFCLFGTGSDTNTFSAILWGWGKANPASGITQPPKTLWVATPLLEVTGTLASGIPGIDGTVVPSSMYFCGTIVSVLSNTIMTQIISPAATGETAWVRTIISGFQKLEFSFKTGSSATDCNALWALF